MDSQPLVVASATGHLARDREGSPITAAHGPISKRTPHFQPLIAAAAAAAAARRARVGLGALHVRRPRRRVSFLNPKVFRFCTPGRKRRRERRHAALTTDGATCPYRRRRLTHARAYTPRNNGNNKGDASTAVRQCYVCDISIALSLSLFLALSRFPAACLWGKARSDCAAAPVL